MACQKQQGKSIKLQNVLALMLENPRWAVSTRVCNARYDPDAAYEIYGLVKSGFSSQERKSPGRQDSPKVEQILRDALYKVLDIEPTPEEMSPYTMAFFPMAQGVRGATGTLIKGETYEPSHGGTIVYFSVDDINEVLRRINANGGKTILPKKSIGEYGFIAHFEDTKGNRLALHSMK